MTRDKEFLGCSWSVLSIEPNRAKKLKRKTASSTSDDFGGYKVLLFATEGPHISKCTIAELFEWFMPTHLNLDQLACKAFARIRLGLSSTYPTLIFRPCQVRQIPDILADGAADKCLFNDPQMTWPRLHNRNRPRVMNDGCSRISFPAAQKIWELIGISGPVPSAFQARIGPWKGVWMISPPVKGYESDEADVWIEVSDSQRKFRPHLEDQDEFTCDTARLTFGVITWTRKPTTSALYRDFLPVLEDRHVPRESLTAFVVGSLQAEEWQLKDALMDSKQLYRYMQDRWFNFEHDDVPAPQQFHTPSTEIKMLLEVCLNTAKMVRSC